MYLALYLLVFSHVCWCMPRPFVCAGHQNPFIGLGQGYSICKFTYTSHLIGGAWTRAFLCKWVCDRLTGHAIIHSLQNPTLKMSCIVRCVNTTQTAIMSAWHYCFTPPICSSRLYILITISKHDAWSPKVFLFDGNECHPATCIPSSRNF